jgi:hypothetical protein
MNRRGSSAEYNFANVLEIAQVEVSISMPRGKKSHEGPSVLRSIKRCKGVNGAVSKTPLVMRTLVV